jgi:hypothetical protein
LDFDINLLADFLDSCCGALSMNWIRALIGKNPKITGGMKPFEYDINIKGKITEETLKWDFNWILGRCEGDHKKAQKELQDRFVQNLGWHVQEKLREKIAERVAIEIDQKILPEVVRIVSEELGVHKLVKDAFEARTLELVRKL